MPATGTPALNLATTYNKVTIFFDFGTVGSGKTYYFDDITFVTGTGTNTLVATFDERNFDNTQSQPSILTGFGGAENSTLVGLPDGLPADGGHRQGGEGRQERRRSVGRHVDTTQGQRRGADDPVRHRRDQDDGAGLQRLRRRACATEGRAVGPPRLQQRSRRLHHEGQRVGDADLRLRAGRLAFRAHRPGPGGYQTDPTKTPYLPTAQLDVTKTFNKVNIFFDYGLGDAGYDAMPGTRTYYFDDVKFIGN